MVYDNSYSVPLPQLLDLALGNPEKGAVNFNVLHALLHIMIQQLELTNTKAEFIDGDVPKIDRLARRVSSEPHFKLEEYIVSKSKDTQDDVSPCQLSLSGKPETVRVTREADVLKEAVVVVMPFGHEPRGEAPEQCVTLTETRFRSTLDKLESGQRPSTTRSEGKRPGSSAARSDISRRNKSEPPGATRPGAVQPGTTAIAPSSASPYQPVAPYPSLPDPATPDQAIPSPPTTMVYPQTTYPPTAYPPPVYEFFPPLQAPTHTDAVRVYNFPPFWHPAAGVHPKELVPGVPEYLATKPSAASQAPENAAMSADLEPCGCNPHLRKRSSDRRSGSVRRSRLGPRKTSSSDSEVRIPEGSALEASAQLPGEQPSTKVSGVGAVYSVEPAPGTPGYWGVMAKIAEEKRLGGSLIASPDGRETLNRLDVVESELHKVLEEKRTAGPQTTEEFCRELKDNLSRVERRLWALEGRLAATDGQLQQLAVAHHGKDDTGDACVDDGIRDSLDARIESNNVIKSIIENIDDIKANCLENEEYLTLVDGARKPIDSLCECLRDMKDIKKCLNTLTGGDYKVFEKGPEPNAPNSDKIRNFEERINVLEDQIIYHNSEVQSLTENVYVIKDQSRYMEKEMSLMSEKFQTLGKMGDSFVPGLTQNISEMSELFNKIHLIQEDLDVVSNTCAKLMEERHERTKNLQSIENQLDTLMHMKADRDELDEALLNKADYVTVNRKVSHDQFDSALEDLTRGLQDAVKKLTQQEQLWQEALNELQHEVGNKLDCQELAPLKDFMNKKLNNLHERLKNLSKVRKQAEAAGTKRKLLKDVSCLSCDVEAVMRRELDGNVPISPALPTHQNMKPYLTYKLDMIRNERKMSRGKHLINLERALNSDKRSNFLIDEGKQATIMKGDHLCNRYCGGSHTLTTAYERIITMDHFVSKDVGPECLQIRTALDDAVTDPMNGKNLTNSEKFGNKSLQGSKKNVLTLPKLKKR